MVAAWFGTKAYPWLQEIRNIPSIDACDEAIRAAAERGKSVYHSPGSLQASTAVRGMFVPGITALMQNSAFQCSTLGIDLYTVVGDSQMQLYVVDAVRTGHVQAGHPERHDISKNFFVGSIQSTMFDSMAVIKDFNVGTCIMTGTYSMGVNVPIYEYAYRQGCTIVASEMWPHEECLAVVGADYVILPEEMMVAGLYLGTRAGPEDAFSTIGLDFIKLLTILLYVVFSIATLAGLR
jgi:hypothetical protein